MSHPGSLQKPGGEGRVALHSLDTRPEATEAHPEAEEGGREKQARAGATHSQGGWHREIWGEACKKKTSSSLPFSHVFVWEPSKPGCCRAAG